MAVFVEDRLLTLDKTMADQTLCTKVLPVLAGWGYNTEEQRASAMDSGYTVSPVYRKTLYTSMTVCFRHVKLNLRLRRSLKTPRTWPPSWTARTWSDCWLNLRPGSELERSVQLS